MFKFYHNSLCLDYNETKYYNNWFDPKFTNFFVSIDACQNTTYNNSCKSMEEINDFMERNVFYFVSQKTLVDKSIYKDKSDKSLTDDN